MHMGGAAAVLCDATERPASWWGELHPDEARQAIRLAYPEVSEGRWPRPGVALLEVPAEALAAG